MRSLLASVLVLVAAASSAAQTRKLNGPLVRDGLGDVYAHILSPDGTRAVYRATHDTEETLELYSVPVDGSSAAVKLNPPLVAAGDVEWPAAISPDSSRVVYVAEQDTDGRLELYSVPLAGGPAVKLNGPMIAAGDVGSPAGLVPVRFAISPDSTRVVYVADQEVDSRFDVYAAPIDGSAPAVRLTSVGTQRVSILDLAITAESERAVYRSEAFVSPSGTLVELFSAPLDASAPPTRLHAPLAAGQGVSAVALAADGSRAFFVGDVATLDVSELFAVPPAGGVPTKLNPSLGAGSHVSPKITLTPDGTRVLFQIDGDVYTVPVAGGPAFEVVSYPSGSVGRLTISPDSSRLVYTYTDATFPPDPRLLSVPLAGGTPVSLDSPMIPNGSIEGLLHITADGARVVFVADRETLDRPELYSTPIAGGTAVQLNPPLAPNGTVSSDDLALSPDGSRVVFIADVADAGVGELFSAPTDGSATAVRLCDALAYGRGAGGASVTADGTRVVYVSSERAQGVQELFSAPLAGGAPPLVLSPDVEPGPIAGDVIEFAVAPGGGAVVYRADQDTNDLAELYLVPASGELAPVRINPANLRDVEAFELSSDGSRVVYVDSLGSRDLRSLALPTLGPPVQLDAAGHFVYGARIHSSGDWVAYDAFDGVARSLFTAPIDGSSVPVCLSGPPVANRNVLDFALNPLGAQVAFRANRDVADRLELYLAAGGPVQKLNGPLTPNGDVENDYAFTANGARVVYRADQEADFRIELYSNTTSPVSTPVKLNDTLVWGGSVQPGFLLGPSGARVFYRADRDAVGVFELYVARTDGATPPLELSAPGANIPTFGIAPDGSRAIYRHAHDLWSVPSDGSAAPVRLNASGPSIETQQFEVTPDSSRVVYVSDSQGGNAFRLHVAPIDGSAPALELSAPLGAADDVEDFWLDPGSELVVYRARYGGKRDLYLVPLDGSRAPMRLNAPHSGPGGVLAGVAFAANRVVYRADTETAGVEELFSSRLPRRTRAGTPDGTLVR